MDNLSELLQSAVTRIMRKKYSRIIESVGLDTDEVIDNTLELIEEHLEDLADLIDETVLRSIEELQ